ncbi:helix-turn-helix transcriptional regulator [Corynebacterium dentalis]|uniref:helix-turn-helix transcriptional regulator n=1 Tax=Corynebacterium dentalis TaxID=2014528 RepID=UPI002897DB05|nr:WYL domain-containing protein [Corynebacterium dentalis]
MNAASHRNQPVDVSWDENTSRLFNLVIALINSPSPRSVDWIIANVAGYDAGSSATNRKRFHRDRASLQAFGVVLRKSTGEAAGAQTTEAWSLDSQELFLPELDLSQEEADALAAAARWNQSESLSGAAKSAYHKLAAAGLQRGLGESVVSSVPDHTELDQASVEAIFRALDKSLRLSFDYYPSLLHVPTRRTVEPWAYGAVDGKIYLTGFDLDREQQRTFRLSRIADMQALPEFTTHPAPNLPAEQLILRGLESAGSRITARLRFTSNSGAEELRALTDASGQIGPVDRSWLLRTAAAYAPEVVVEEPSDLVDDIISLLHAVANEPGGTDQ